MLERGSTATDYQPYNGRSISISLGQTVYSGYVDVVTGVVTVTHGHIVVTGNTSGLQMLQISSSEYYRIRFPITGIKNIASSAVIDGVCNMYPVISSDRTWARNEGIGTQGGNWVYIYDPNYNAVDSLDGYKAFLNANNLVFVYELATPIPIQLTPQEIESLLGENVMFTPCDSLTVEYRSN